MSQSMLDLKKFRFQKHASVKAEKESLDMVEDASDTIPAETADSPQTSPVIGRRRITSCQSDASSVGADAPQRPDDQSESPVFKARSIKRCVLSDSDDTEPGPDGAGPGPDDPAHPDNIERNLAFMREAFPEHDVMDLQDCLWRHGWLLEPAMTSLDAGPERPPVAGAAPPPVKRRRLLKLCSDTSDEDTPDVKVSLDAVHGSALIKREEDGCDKRETVVPVKPAAAARRRPKVAASAPESDDDDDFEVKYPVYCVSDSDDEQDGAGRRPTDEARLRTERAWVVDFLDTATADELACMASCSRKKAELIVEQRPFTDWSRAVAKFTAARGLTPHLLNEASRVQHMRGALRRLLTRCEEISLKLKARVTELIQGDDDRDKIVEQPSNLNPEMHLSPYQMIGLSWLILMFKEGLNAVLADEMGLGKTIQAVSFLAYLQQQEPAWKYLVVVPSSTLDNWARELSVWCPSLQVVEYRGLMEQRRETRHLVLYGDVGWHVMLTTYNIVASSADDRQFFKNVHFKYIVFDEAHMLKNMASKRYTNLMKLKGEHRLLLTGTPLQNNLVELISLLVFVMPHMFGRVRDSLQTIFEVIPKSSGQKEGPAYGADRISEAKRIMSPFFLRRLKRNVLRDLPAKTERVQRVPMTATQAAWYRDLRDNYVREASDKLNGAGPDVAQSAVGMVMSMRKLANHPLLVRRRYTEAKLREITKIFLSLPGHEHKQADLVCEDLSYLSDFEVHQTCKLYQDLHGHLLPDEAILESGKFAALDELLPRLKADGSRVLLFSQFVIMLNVLEAYMQIRGHRFCRLDGQTAVTDRLQLIDQYNSDRDIFVFLLSTRAGGLGINLSSANVVILHDVDFNPHNDRQAEDRCHRIGQTREVHVIRLICTNSIDECMLKVGQEKLSLDRDISGGPEDKQGSPEDPKDVRHLLALALEAGDS